METFSALLPFVREIHRSPLNSPHKGQWRGALMFSLICIWINGWVNNREAGDLRSNRAHYNIIVMNKGTMVIPRFPPWHACAILLPKCDNIGVQRYCLYGVKRHNEHPIAFSLLKNRIKMYWRKIIRVYDHHTESLTITKMKWSCPVANHDKTNKARTLCKSHGRHLTMFYISIFTCDDGHVCHSLYAKAKWRYAANSLFSDFKLSAMLRVIF